jgi:rRNA maturation endonuclease Nob1
VTYVRPRLESWVEETERKVRLIIDHYPRCQRCAKVILGSAARPWSQTCRHCGSLNATMEEVVVS